jgi:hypothetical protein
MLRSRQSHHEAQLKSRLGSKLSSRALMVGPPADCILRPLVRVRRVAECTQAIGLHSSSISRNWLNFHKTVQVIVPQFACCRSRPDRRAIVSAPLYTLTPLILQASAEGSC